MSNEIKTEIEYKLTSKDFSSDQDVRWCPGCGDYSILAQVQRILPELKTPKENYVFVSGIGCSSRFPYYMNSYGIHGIHGRAAAIASGLKISRPDLSVWIATGDGDLLSIGGNHFIHLLRRNIDLNILLFNNKIYGLTKGQYSPTSEHGKKTKSSPFGVIDHPINPLLLALGAEGTFIARSIDREPKHLQQTLLKAAKHKGTSFIEIFQNCNVFNDGAFELLTEKETKSDNVVILEHGKPLIFGKENNKGIRLDGFKPEIIDIKSGKNSINDVLVYDEKSKDLAYIIARLTDNPEFPTPIGVFLDIERSTYNQEMHEQIESAKKKLGEGSLEKLFNSGNTWTIADN